MDTLSLKSLVLIHKEKFFKKKDLIKRELLNNFDKELNSREIIFIYGIRRSGKSSLLNLIAKDLIHNRKIPSKNILFVNFEDERFINFRTEDFDKLFTLFLELENPKGKKYLFFDEIQNIEGWERWINRLYEFEDVKIFLIGSNASLVNSLISSSLTGRNRQKQVHTFSFKEFLLLRDITLTARDLFLPENVALVKREFNNYLHLGGFPEVIKNNDATLAAEYFRDIIFRDVVSNYNIRNIKELRELSLYLITNTGTIFSYDALRQALDAKNNSTIKNFLNILQEVFLFYSLPKFDFSIKKQIYNPNKYFVADVGFYEAIGFKFSKNLGKLLENIVFEQLLRSNKEIYYWRSSKGEEVDFIIRENTKLKEAYQVTFSLNKNNIKRETGSLLRVAEELNIRKRNILTYDQEETIKDEFGEIKVLPVWKWLLG